MCYRNVLYSKRANKYCIGIREWLIRLPQLCIHSSSLKKYTNSVNAYIHVSTYNLQYIRLRV